MTRQYIFEFYKVIYRVTWRFKIRKNKNEVTKYTVSGKSMEYIH
jgi:hypothetical protein